MWKSTGERWSDLKRRRRKAFLSIEFTENFNIEINFLLHFRKEMRRSEMKFKPIKCVKKKRNSNISSGWEASFIKLSTEKMFDGKIYFCNISFIHRSNKCSGLAFNTLDFLFLIYKINNFLTMEIHLFWVRFQTARVNIIWPMCGFFSLNIVIFIRNWNFYGFGFHGHLTTLPLACKTTPILTLFPSNWFYFISCCSLKLIYEV